MFKSYTIVWVCIYIYMCTVYTFIVQISIWSVLNTIHDMILFVCKFTQPSNFIRTFWFGHKHTCLSPYLNKCPLEFIHKRLKLEKKKGSCSCSLYIRMTNRALFQLILIEGLIDNFSILHFIWFSLITRCDMPHNLMRDRRKKCESFDVFWFCSEN